MTRSGSVTRHTRQDHFVQRFAIAGRTARGDVVGSRSATQCAANSARRARGRRSADPRAHRSGAPASRPCSAPAMPLVGVFDRHEDRGEVFHVQPSRRAANGSAWRKARPADAPRRSRRRRFRTQPEHACVEAFERALDAVEFRVRAPFRWPRASRRFRPRWRHRVRPWAGARAPDPGPAHAAQAIVQLGATRQQPFAGVAQSVVMACSWTPAWQGGLGRVHSPHHLPRQGYCVLITPARATPYSANVFHGIPRRSCRRRSMPSSSSTTAAACPR